MLIKGLYIMMPHVQHSTHVLPTHLANTKLKSSNTSDIEITLVAKHIQFILTYRKYKTFT